MQTTIDKFGRILIPKEIRDRLDLKPEALVQILEHDHGILLKLVENKIPLENQNGVLVFTGKARGDIESAIAEECRKARRRQ